MAKEDCVICGEEHPRCNAHNTKGDPCMRWPREGTDVCRNHGGAAPQVVAAGEARRAAKALEADANAVLGYSLDGKVPDVLSAMEGLAAASLNMVEALAQRVNDLARVRYGSDYSVEQIRGEVVLLERAMDRSAKMLELLAKHKPDGEAAAAVNLLTSLSDQIKNLDLGE